MYFISSIFIDHGYEYAKDSFEKKVKKNEKLFDWKFFKTLC